MKYQVNNILQSQQAGSGLVSPQGSWSHPYFTQSQSQHEDGESEQNDCLTLFDSSRSSFVATTWERTFLLYNVSFTSSSRRKMNRNTLTSTLKPYWAEDGCRARLQHTGAGDIQGVCLEVSQKFYLISRLFLEIETWYFTWRCSIMGHLIIKKWCDQYHLLDISNDCVKKFKDFRSYRKLWPFHILRESIAQNVFQKDVFWGKI